MVMSEKRDPASLCAGLRRALWGQDGPEVTGAVGVGA